MAGFGGSVKLTGESAYRKALKQITLDLKEVDSELKVVASQYAKNDKSQEALTAKSEALAKKLETQAKKVETLRASYQALSKSTEDNKTKHAALGKELENAVKELEKIEKESGKDSAAYKLQAGAVANLTADYNASLKAIDAQEAALSKARIEINNAQTAYNQTGNALSDLNEEIEKTADGANELGDEVKTSGDLAKKAANGGYTVFKNILANLATIAIKQVATGLKKIGEGFVNTGKEAFNAYAEYEQLVGGVETLFGKSAKTLEKYANEAYKTAGLSANSYMESVTSFSSALIKSLDGDTQKAVEYADKAIKDMSDNANKFGTSIDTIQSVYSALARNTYTTLDNLKLGFAGTKQGAEDLVKEAERLDKSFKAQRDSSGKLKLAYSDLVDSIHIVQTNMGITGATAAEANTTIEGSAKAMKAAWSNLLVSVASDNKDMSKSVKAFTQSVETYAKNAIPRVKKLVENMFKAAKDLSKKYMPEFSRNVLPTIEKIGKALKEVATFVVKNFKQVATVVLTAAAAFTTFNAVMAVSKTVTATSTALAALSATTATATKVQVGYNAALAANPIGAVLTAVVALTAAVYALAQQETESQKKIRETAEAYQEEKQAAQEYKDAITAEMDAINELYETQGKQYAAGMQEIGYYENLARELGTLVDANGKVKEGYEERANFITNELNKALGMEISWNNDVIENYTGIKNAINEIIKAKKAEIMLNAQAEMYNEALANIGEATQKLGELEKNRNAILDEQADVQNIIAGYEKEIEAARAANDTVKIDQYNRLLATEKDHLDEINGRLNEANDLYEQQDAIVSTYTYNMVRYEKNVELASKGAYEQMSADTWSYVQTLENASDAKLQTLQNDTDVLRKQLEVVEDLYKAGDEAITEYDVKAAQDRLAEKEKEMSRYIATQAEAMGECKVIWQDSLDDQLSAITGKKVEFRDAGNGLVSMYIDGQKQGEPMTKQEAADLVTVTMTELSKAETGGKTAGEQVIVGLNNGIGNKAKQSSLFGSVNNLADKLVSTLKNKLQVKSPSRIATQIGLFFDEGLDKGIQKGTRDTIAQVTEYANAVTNTLQKEIKDGANFKGLTAGLNEELKATNPALAAGGIQGAATLISSGSDRAITGGFDYKTMVSAFKDALAQVNIELDDQKVGKFVTKTVTNAIYY